MLCENRATRNRVTLGLGVLSNQKKADENCRKVKVTQIMVFLQSSSAFFKIPLSNKRRLIKTAFFKITLSNKKRLMKTAFFKINISNQKKADEKLIKQSPLVIKQRLMKK